MIVPPKNCYFFQKLILLKKLIWAHFYQFQFKKILRRKILWTSDKHEKKNQLRRKISRGRRINQTAPFFNVSAEWRVAAGPGGRCDEPQRVPLPRAALERRAVNLAARRRHRRTDIERTPRHRTAACHDGPATTPRRGHGTAPSRAPSPRKYAPSPAKKPISGAAKAQEAEAFLGANHPSCRP